MLDKSRMVLCMALLALFIFNPFSSLVTPLSQANADFETDGSRTGRTILSTDSNISWLEIFKLSASTLLLWTIYAMIFLAGMAKIFIYGEASIPEKSDSMNRFWVHRKQADSLMKEDKEKAKKAGEVVKELKMAVEALGRPVPTGFVELVLSVLWQSLHQALHRLGIVRW